MFRVQNPNPYELWNNKSASINHLKVFGTKCFVQVPKEKRRKLDKKSMKGILVGYVEKCRGYRVYIPELRDVVVIRDVIFESEKIVRRTAEIVIIQNNHQVFHEMNKAVHDSSDSQ